MVDDSSLLKKFSEQLQSVGIKNSWRELRHLMAYITDESYEAHFFGTATALTSAQFDQLKELVSRRCRGAPLSKIIGKREFWGLSFKVTKDTLDPRADSEALIQAIIDTFTDHSKPLSFIDFGTGTGCLLISLLKEYPNALGVAADKSEMAIKVAFENATTLGVRERITFCVSDWAQPLQGIFDVIISNPPYIGINEPLDLNVKDYDPSSALFAGEDGLDAYRSLFSQIAKHCHQDTRIFFEIGRGQKEAVQEIASDYQFSVVDVYKDFGDVERVVQLRAELERLTVTFQTIPLILVSR
jgi:release factor glutamine methyltransferase